MLHHLRIVNLAIVEKVAVEFQPGLNVVTGETGAGKSILVGALNLVLGARADRSLIRAGADRCSVEAAFDLRDAGGVNAALEALDMPPCEDGRLVVRRAVTASGSNRVFVNDSPATVQALKTIGDLLVDMHGPHDHQSLLNPEFQLAVLDAFAGLDDERGAYEAHYRRAAELERQVRALDVDEQQTARQIDLLTFQIGELEAAELDTVDEQELDREHACVANASRILELSDAVCRALTEDEQPVFDAVTFVRNRLAELAELVPRGREWEQEAESLAVRVQELAADVSGFAQGVEADPARQQWIEDRLALIHKLKRKYGANVEDMLAHLQQARDELAALETRDEKLAAITAERDRAREAMTTAGGRLSGKRRKAAAALARRITRELRDLGFEHGTFGVDLAGADPRPSGLDVVEFGFAPNAGEPSRPLRAIASSGEISRVMLAVKTVLAAHDRIPVLIFDEIDANVGGETANAVGAKLRAVADARQVVCITHLPQVAVNGTSHFVVTKGVEGGRTRTGIAVLSPSKRVEEIARMLGGRDLTSVTLKHAREMLAGSEAGSGS
jgi:DNA repair protein RecN (Recombination protein N)